MDFTEKFKQNTREIVNEEPIKGLGLNLIGIGGDRAVFETPGSLKKIIKVSKRYIEQKIFNIINKKFNDTDDEDIINEDQRHEISENNKIENDLSEFFGDEHVLKHGVFKTKIPFTKETMIKFFEGNDFVKSEVEKLDDTIYEINLYAETQPKAEELIDKEKFHTKDLRTYLITPDDFYGASDVPEALSYVRELIDDRYSNFEEYLEEEKYIGKAKEIITKIIEYTKKTGFAIDIYGPNNITIFTKEDGSVDYHLIDVIMPRLEFYEKVSVKDDKNLDLLRHNYVFYYSIKSLADKLGVKDNIEPEDMNYFKGVGIPTEGKFPIKE